MQKKTAGFSLVELMVAVAVVGILVGIAYPSYLENVRQTRRTDAQVALLALANAMERYYTENYTYAGAALGAGGIFPSEAPLDGNDKYYDLSITAADATSFTIGAAPKNGQAGDRCGTMTLTSVGARGAAAGDCWQ